MLEHWFPQISLPLTESEFARIPRHAAYNYEFWDGEAHLTPSPRLYHCELGLARRAAPETLVLPNEQVVRIRPLAPDAWPELTSVFHAAFSAEPPLSLVESPERARAAQDCLDQTRSGGSGPLVAARVACRSTDAALMGAILITLIPDGNLEDPRDDKWRETAPSDAFEQRWGRPHLSWVFVHPQASRSGVASALLAHAVNDLLAAGYETLVSTFLLGNESSMLWHWHNGFRLLRHPGSQRAIPEI